MTDITKKFGLVLAIFLGVICGVVFHGPYIVNATAIDGQANFSTTTPQSTSITTLAFRGGIFSSVIITKTDTGTMLFYDATTSDVTKRTGNTATSSLLLTSFAASPTAQAYPYDIQLTNGLLMITTGSAASTTVTWK